MRSIFELMSRKRGLAPGTIPHPEERPHEPPVIEVIEYSPDRHERHTVATPAEAMARVGSDHVTWINVDGLWDVAMLHEFGDLLGLHPLLVEDVGTPVQRPKLEEQDDYLMAVFRVVALVDEDVADTAELQVSLILKENLLVTLREGKCGGAFDAVRGRIEVGLGRIRKDGAPYLLYALLDSLVDQGFVLLAAVEDRIATLEELLETEEKLPDVGPETIPLRRAVGALKRAAVPARDMLGSLVRCESDLIPDVVRPYLQDAQEHSVQVAEGAETVRESIANLLEAHRSAVSVRTNEVMRVLTIIASIFIPITFVAGVYGMNFQSMPELGQAWGYPAVLVIMATVAAGMLWYFKRKDWL